MVKSFHSCAPRYIHNHTFLAATHKQLLDAVSHLEQSTSHLQVSCRNPVLTTSVQLPLDCWDVLQDGHNSSGVYRIQPSGSPEAIMVYCNMDSDGGGWTVSTGNKACPKAIRPSYSAAVLKSVAASCPIYMYGSQITV